MATRRELMQDLRDLSSRSAWHCRRLLLEAAEQLDSRQLEDLVDAGWQGLDRDDVLVQAFEHYRRQVLRARARMTTRRARRD